MVQQTQPRLTQEQKDWYLNNDGNYCPYCKSSNINGEYFEAGGIDAWRGVYCNDCDGIWTDLYELYGVE